MQYRALDPDKTIQTLRILTDRIEERFPGASLAGVCRELLTIAEETCSRIRWLSKPHAIIRGAVLVVIALAVWLGWYVVGRVKFHTDGFSIEELEAATNGAVLLGAALFFLISLESRLKRRGVLAAINELRAISHVIDMHQLTKDPSQVTTTAGQRTRSSPQRVLTPFELSRYLDYCSELLSLIGKLAALYAQSTSDGIVLQSVNDIESLTNGISRKIWQKIMILDDDLERVGQAAAAVSSATKLPEPGIRPLSEDTSKPDVSAATVSKPREAASTLPQPGGSTRPVTEPS
jgi:hypothetical protein